MKEMHVIFYGTVQGVGFRACIAKHVDALGLKGSVENCDKGTVKLVIQGEQDQLDHLIEKIKTSPGRAIIDSMSFLYLEPIKNFQDFKILR